MLASDRRRGAERNRGMGLPPDFHVFQRSSHVLETRYRWDVEPEPKSSGSWEISDATIQVCSSSLSLARSA